MAIRRTEIAIDSQFTTIPNEMLRDSRLSLKARGLLALLMSHRVGWVVSIESLARDNPEGKAAIRSAINELEECGYLKRELMHSEDGTFAGYDYTLQFAPSCGYPTTGYPTTGYPTTDNRTPKNTIPKKTNTKENQSKTGGDKSPAAQGELVKVEKKKPTHQEITQWVYDQVNGAINFKAVMNVVKHSLKRGHEPGVVAKACVGIHRMGKPITNQTVGQWIDGTLGGGYRIPSAQERDNELKAALMAAAEEPQVDGYEYF